MGDCDHITDIIPIDVEPTAVSSRFITNQEEPDIKEIFNPENKSSKSTHGAKMEIQIDQIIREEQTSHVPFLKYYINLEKSQGKVRRVPS